jgi:uncharacterized protein
LIFKNMHILHTISLLIFAYSCQNTAAYTTKPATISVTDSLPRATAFGARLAEAALTLTKDQVRYDPTYRLLPYPNGDVPANTGVCTDVVIRAYRKLGIDLQQRVHEDMKANFSAYPKTWGLKRPDTNIDHRRVPNLARFFERQGAKLPVTQRGTDYQPGDVVTWLLDSGLTHIGLVSAKAADGGGRHYLIVHNIGSGQVLEDVLFEYRITGHYRWGK